MTCIHIGDAILTVQGEHKPGDPRPAGFLAWYEWSEAQAAGGLQQTQCPGCGRWNWPQELTDSGCERCKQSRT